jgi:CPA2 family monovalent cation:H+ antiporter-2
MATPFSEFLSKKLPRKWIKRIERYSANAQSIKSVSNWQKVINSYLTLVIVVSVIIVATILLSSRFILPMVENFKFGNALGALITLVFLSPFLWALSMRRVAAEEVSILMEERKYRGPIIMMILFRLLLTIFFIGFLLNIFFSPFVAIIALIAALFIYFAFRKKLNQQYHKIENHFLTNLNDREITRARRSRSDLSPWDGHMAYFEIAKESNIIGKTLKDLQIREQMGINIASIKRGDIMINIPKRNDRLFPSDEICIIGNDTQVNEFKKYLEQHEIEVPSTSAEAEIVLRQIELKNESYIGKTIRESKLREKTHGLVVGIEKRGNRILNPESDIVLEKDDILWIVGDKKLLTDLVHD